MNDAHESTLNIYLQPKPTPNPSREGDLAVGSEILVRTYQLILV